MVSALKIKLPYIFLLHKRLSYIILYFYVFVNSRFCSIS